MNCQLNRFNDAAFVYLSIQVAFLDSGNSHRTKLYILSCFILIYLVKVQSSHGVEQLLVSSPALSLHILSVEPSCRRVATGRTEQSTDSDSGPADLGGGERTSQQTGETIAVMVSVGAGRSNLPQKLNGKGLK